jgi:Predicted GTPase
LIIQIVDMRHPPSALDMQMIEFLHRSNLPFVIVLSKSDKLNKTQRSEREKKIEKELEKYNDTPKIVFSYVSGEGLEKIKVMISSYSEF